ncbi:MAG: replication initiation protein RepC, partial [Rubrimonas sp.]
HPAGRPAGALAPTLRLAGRRAGQAAALPARLPANAGLGALQAIRERLRAIADVAREALAPAPPAASAPTRSESPSPTPGISARPAISDRHHHSENPRNVHREHRADAHRNLHARVEQAAPTPDPARLAHGATELFRKTLTEPHPGWPAFIDAARQIALLHGIGPELWAEACAMLGRRDAAIAMWLTDLRADPRAPVPVRSPGAYLRGLLHAARDGRLRLAASAQAALRRRDDCVARPGKIADAAPVHRASRLRPADYPRITEVL